MQKERKYNDYKLNAAVRELDTYRQRQREISHLTSKLEEYRECYCEVESIRYDSLRVKGGMKKNKLVEIALKWADMSALINEKKLEAERELWLIKTKLEMLTSLQSRVLELYYLKGYTIVKIAQIINYSDEGVKSIKYNALKKYANL